VGEVIGSEARRIFLGAGVGEGVEAEAGRKLQKLKFYWSL